MPDLDDITFIRELIQQRDADPTARATGRTVATGLGHPDADTEPIVRRLKDRGYIDWSPTPRRMGDGWNTRDLIVTEAGYAKFGT